MTETPPSLPFDVHFDLPGWELFWAHVSLEPDATESLADLRTEVAQRARQRFAKPADLSTHPTVSAMRRLFRAAGCDPTRYRPASEALARRLLKGDELPAIHPLVDLNNCLSVEILVPCCVMVEGSFGTSLALRAGRDGESYVSLRGPFKLDGKPLLADGDVPLDTPITGNEKVKVQQGTERAWLVAYLPTEVRILDEASQAMAEMAPRAGVEAVIYS